MGSAPSLVWLRCDLRTDDHAALAAAVTRDRPIIPVFCWDPADRGPWSPGAASRWWLHHSLGSLHRELAELGSRLVLRLGPPGPALSAVAEETGADALFYNVHAGPPHAAEQALVEQHCAGSLALFSYPNGTLFDHDEIVTRSGRPYQVFTPFLRACLAACPPPRPLRRPPHLPAPAAWPHSEHLESLGLMPAVDWARGFRHTWEPGAAGADHRLHRMTDRGLRQYHRDRDRPDRLGTSGLSPHLHHGEVSLRRAWHTVTHSRGDKPFPDLPEGHRVFLQQLLWREFSLQLLAHHPHTADQPLRTAFTRFPWRNAADEYQAWCHGRTGYPFVDAAMRQLWRVGWMHNRARLVAASFLVKDLLLPWQLGAAWFWDTLVDADLAANSLNWQWCAGCGPDAAPFVRIFNPVLQGRRFDPEGRYVRRWLPELAELPDAYLHAPWTAPATVLAQAGVELGANYPRPLVDHDTARRRALAAFASLRPGAGAGD